MGSSHRAQQVAGPSEAEPSTSGRGISCPLPESARRGAVYDVYGQRIDGARGQDAGPAQCLRQVVALAFLLLCAALDLPSSVRTSPFQGVHARVLCARHVASQRKQDTGAHQQLCYSAAHFASELTVSLCVACRTS